MEYILNTDLISSISNTNISQGIAGGTYILQNDNTSKNTANFSIFYENYLVTEKQYKNLFHIE